MRIQWKIPLLVFLTLVATLAAVVWKTRTVLIKDKLDFMADSSMKQIAPLKRLVQERLEDQKTRLVKFAALHASQGTSRSNPFGDFEVVALVQPSVATGTPGAETPQWAPAWVEKSAGVKIESWPQGFEQTLLKSLPYGKVKDGETLWSRVSDHQGSPLYAVMISVEIQNATSAPGTPPPAPTGDLLPDTTDYRAAPTGSGKKAIVVGFASQDPIANITEDYIGSINTVFIVDDRGYIASHVNKAYLGSLFTEDPIVQEIVRTRKTAASGNYEDLESHSVLGHFERIDRTNLFAVITAPLDTVNASVGATTSMAVKTGAAVGLLFVILAWLLGRGISRPIEETIQAIGALNRGEKPQFKTLESKDEIGTLMRLLAESSPTALQSKANWNQEPKAGDSDTGTTGTTTGSDSRVAILAANSDRLAQERRSTYEAFNKGFTEAMKEPLMAILGHAQLSKSKTHEADVKSHSESIEREARRAKDVLDRLASWTGGPAMVDQTSRLDMEKIVESVLAQIEPELKSEGIELVRELHAVPRTLGSESSLRESLIHMIENAREAMRARAKKVLKIQLDYLSDRVYLAVNDTGIGMSRTVKERAFDPFFKGFDSPKRIGLGLSFVQAAVKNMGGTAEIESVPGEGATVTLKIAVSAEDKQAFRENENVKLAQSNAARFTAEKSSASALAVPASVSPPVLPPVPVVGKEPPPTPPAGASVKSASSFAAASEAPVSLSLDDDDDEEEMFASVALNSAPKPSPPPPIESSSGISETKPDEFRVRIRRPRVRS